MESSIIVILMVMQLFLIKNQPFCTVKCISDLQETDPSFCARGLQVEVEEKEEFDVLEELMKGQNKLGLEGNEWVQK